MPNTSLTFGPFLLGAFLNAVLYGVSVLQCFIYYQTYRKDPQWIRYFVLYLFIVETLNTVCNIGLVYEPLIMNYGDPVSFRLAPLMIIAQPLLSFLVSTPVQIFIAWRIKIISQSTVIPIIIGILSICAFIGALAITISVSFFREYSELRKSDGAVITALISAGVADILITAFLYRSLMIRKTGVKSTDDKLSRIVRLTLQTGLVTATFDVLDAILFLTLTSTTVNFIWDLPMSQLYTNSLLSTLNARAGWDHLAGAKEPVNVLFGTQEMYASREKSSSYTISVQPNKKNSDVIKMEAPSVMTEQTGDIESLDTSSYI